ncbi:tetratricopeptide repeat protein [Promicromonospora umidemergens]|uniref:tetratricopeptide repeat protein n=1 Tax=Promicromonospora umidemergens TaxID=629679 RepID=UPI0020A2F194|nr:tetratricopeptide repeat protein [Promicromonospora umidemergens]
MSISTSQPGAAVADAGSPGRLLAPARRIVPFVGRAAELISLIDWCSGPDPVAVRLISGPRGVGKTRLAREVAHRLAHAGWTCLDVPDGAEPAALAAVPDGAPALLLIDDAETRGPALADLLRAAARDRAGALRVLLVARGAGEWFSRLSMADVTVRALLEPARARGDLGAEVFPGQVDARLVAAFVQPYARALGLAAPRVAVASVPGGGARMLDLQAAALCAVLRAQAQARAPRGALPVDVSDALGELLEHERWSWFRSAEEAGVLGEAGFLPKAMDGLVAAATLTGVRTPDAAENLVRRVSAVVPGVRPGAEGDVGRWLLDLDPHRALPGRLVDPHLLAELTDVPELLGACLAGAGAAAARRAALRAAGIVVEQPGGPSEDQGAALDRLGAAIAALPEEHDTLRSVSGVLPYPSLALGELRAELTLRTLAATPVGDLPSRAEALRDVGVALGEVGRATDAEQYQREALALFRELAAADPHRFRLRLAALLVNLGTTYSDQGRPQEALRCVEESVDLLRLVAADRPGVVTLDLTMAVSNLAVTFAELGRPLAALEPSREAARLWRELSRANPERFAWALALALMNVARRLLELGRAREAHEPAAESLEIRRRLAAADPDEHLSGLGDSLQVMGSVLADQGRAEEALPYLEEAVEIRRRTAQENPGRYLPDLARSLQSLGTRLADAGRRAEGLDLQQEAVEVRRRLVADDPARYVPDLADALSAVGVTHARLGRPQDALDVEREATRTWRGLVGSEPDRYRPRLAQSLTNVSSAFAVLRLGDEAVPPACEAVALLRELATDDAARYRPRLAEALRVLTLALHDQERFDEAQRARAEAEELVGSPAP